MLVNNRLRLAHDEKQANIKKAESEEYRSRMAGKLDEAQALYAAANTAFMQAQTTYIQDKNNREAMLAFEDAALKRASAAAYLAQANATSNADARAQALHEYEAQIKQQLLDMGATEHEILKVQQHISQLWNTPLWESAEKLGMPWYEALNAKVRDFIHNNIRLS